MTISMVMPTHNRPRFLARSLRYYRSLGFPHKMIIADSSSEPAASANRHLIRTEGDGLQIQHQPFAPEIDGWDKIAQAVNTTDSTYVVFGADDDFTVPRMIERGAAFLEAHPDYSAVHGEAALFEQHVDGARRGIGGVSRYLQRSIEHPTGAQRLLDHLGHYSTTFYSVQRTEHLRESYRKAASLGIGLGFTELLLSCLSIIQGKARKLDGLYMMREGHAEMTSRQEHGQCDAFDWVTDPNWPSHYQGFRDCLAEALARQDGNDIGEARDIAKRAFWLHMGQVLTKKWPGSSGRPAPASRRRLREAARRVPGLRWTWRAARSLMPGRNAALSLEALQRPFSRYHEDFLPIYRAIMGENSPKRRQGRGLSAA